MTQYILSLLRPSTHLFDVEVTVQTGGAEHLDLEFPAWSPGRYFIYDFARNVQELAAFGRSGEKLRVEKIAKGTWRAVTRGEDAVRFTYRMFGDTLGGTFSQLDDRHAAVNGSSVFGYVIGHETEPVELEVRAPEGWKSYSSMKSRRRSGRNVLQAENYDVLIDSPLEIGTPLVRRFVVDNITYHVVLDFAGGAPTIHSTVVREKVDQYLQDVENVVRTQTKTFGRPEFSDYYFLVNIDPYAAGGDGMEHLASTRLVLPDYITGERYSDLIGVTSHEFFHIWNVKRLRPAELGPFDYTKERHTTLLWFAEGFTQYYGHLMLSRAGVWDQKQFFKELAEEVNQVDKAPGRAHRNLPASSFDTWQITGARNPGTPSNFKNTYVNYYHKGAVAALVLDLEIRRASGDKRSLDDVIRRLYDTHYHGAEVGSYYLRGTGYGEKDVFDAITYVGGKGMRPLLRHVIESTSEIDYARYLKYVGLEITREPRAKGATKTFPAYSGAVVADPRQRTNAEFIALVNVLENSPAEQAGLSAGDLVVALDGERVDGKRWDAVLQMKKPGERVEFTFFRGPRLMRAVVQLEERDMRPFRIQVSPKISATQKKALKNWMGSLKGGETD